MEGCREEKKLYGFERVLVLIQNIYVTFDRRKETAQCKIFLAKRLVYFFAQLKTQFKTADFFFSKDNFPAKRLTFFGAHFSSLKTFSEKEILFAELR